MAAPGEIPPHIKIPSAALSSPLPYQGSKGYRGEPSPADAEAGRTSPVQRGGQAGPMQSEELQQMRSCFGLCLIPARFLALSFAVIAFSLIASTGTKTTEVGDVRILGRSYKAFRTLAYVVASNVIVAVYALCVGIGGTLVRFGCARTTDVSKVVMSYFIQLGDLSLSFLQFGAATAVAGLRGGFSDLRTSYDYCSTNDSFCRKLVAATVFSYLAWLSLVPNLMYNIQGNERGPW